MAYLTLFCRKFPKNSRKKSQRSGRGGGSSRLGQNPNFYRKFVLHASLKGKSQEYVQLNTKSWINTGMHMYILPTDSPFYSSKCSHIYNEDNDDDGLVDLKVWGWKQLWKSILKIKNQINWKFTPNSRLRWWWCCCCWCCCWCWCLWWMFWQWYDVDVDAIMYRFCTTEASQLSCIVSLSCIEHFSKEITAIDQ